MNDRSQAGTSLSPGSIQLMQNRRMFSDDIRGVNEYLNERDDNNNGMRVKATYHLEFVDQNLGTRSVQRYIQQHIEEPLQLFFANDLIPIKTLQTPGKYILSKALKAAGIEGSVKIVTFPLE